MKNQTQRSCNHCQCCFNPDPRNRHHQQYCSKPECRRASKQASQKRWASKPENRDYFRGPENVQRVQEWRARHQGYWHHQKQAQKDPPDPCQAGSSSEQIIESQESFSPSVSVTSPLSDHDQAYPQTMESPNSSVTRDLIDQPIETTGQSQNLTFQTSPLQDLLTSQHFVLIGLIAHFTGFTLQDDIAAIVRQLLQLGQDVLNNATSPQLSGGINVSCQTTSLPGTTSPHSRSIQLG